MKEKENFYEILSLPNFSQFEEIKIKYKQLIKQSHPDKGGNRENFERIKKAYDYLKEPKLKLEYDRKLKYLFQMYEKAEEIKFNKEDKNEFECMQCFNLNKIDDEYLKNEITSNESDTIHIMKCESCSMIYKITF